MSQAGWSPRPLLAALEEHLDAYGEPATLEDKCSGTLCHWDSPSGLHTKRMVQARHNCHSHGPVQGPRSPHSHLCDRRSPRQQRALTSRCKVHAWGQPWRWGPRRCPFALLRLLRGAHGKGLAGGGFPQLPSFSFHWGAGGAPKRGLTPGTGGYISSPTPNTPSPLSLSSWYSLLQDKIGQLET